MAKKKETGTSKEEKMDSATIRQAWGRRLNAKVNMKVLDSLDLKDKIFYLALHGWKMEIEERSENQYLYAVKYIERKKRRIYLAKTANFIDLYFPKKAEG